MLDYKDLLYFYFSSIFFLQLLTNAGLKDYGTVPAVFSYSFFFIFGLFSFFNSNKTIDNKSRQILKLNLVNVVFLAAITLVSRCIEISYIEISKYLSATLLMFSLFMSITNFNDLRSFLRIFLYFAETYIFMTFTYYCYFKYVAGVYFSGICFTMFYPYYYATFVIAVTPLSIYFYLTSQKKYEKLNFFVLFLACCTSVLLTSSRIAQINLIISVTFTLGYFLRHAGFSLRAMKFISIIFIFVILAGGFFATDAFTRIAKSFSNSENFDIHDENGRINIYRGALKTFMDNPLIGVGPALSSMFITKYRVTKMTITDCHNIILNRLCETGIFYTCFSFFTLLATLYMCIKTARANYDRSQTSPAHFGPVCAIALLTIYLQGFSMPHTFLTSLVYLEYFLISLALCSIKINSPAFISENITNYIDFSFSQKNMIISSLFSFLLVFVPCFIILKDELIQSLLYWVLNLFFLAAAFIIFLLAKKRNKIKNSFAMMLMASALTSLLLIQLGFQYKIFKSGFLCQLGIDESASGKNKRALTHFEESVKIYPNMASHLFLSSLYHRFKNFEKAYNAAIFYNERLPYEIFGLNNLSSCLISMKRNAEAKKKLTDLDRYCAGNYSSAFNGAFLMTGGEISAGACAYANAAINNPEYISNKFFFQKIIQDQTLADSLFNFFLSDACKKFRSKPEFLTFLSYRVAEGMFNFYNCGYQRDAFFSTNEFYKREYNNLQLSKFNSSITLIINGLLNLKQKILLHPIYLRRISNYLNGFYAITFNDTRQFKTFHAIKFVMKLISPYSDYKSYKKYLESVSLNYSAHFGLKYWFDFENAMIDPYALHEPAPKIPQAFISLILYAAGKDVLKSSIASYYKDYYGAQ